MRGGLWDLIYLLIALVVIVFLFRLLASAI